jgi:small subunit ribosomal protein S3
MSHSVHPYAHRLGIIRDWKSRWFGSHGQYQKYLKADILLREFFAKRLRGMYVDGVDIERGRNSFHIIVKTARPGMIIGRSGEGVTKLKNDVLSLMRKNNIEIPRDVKLDIEEVRQPEAHAHIVAEMIAEALEKRLPFRRVMKQTLEKVMANRNVKGAKIVLSGRLGGTDIGRSEYLKEGRIPLQTLRADIDFAREKAHMSYGDIGIKVWIYKGEIFEEKKA